MKLASKVDHEFTIKLNLAEAEDLLNILDAAGGQTGRMCYLYDALLTEFRNLNLNSY